jgi:SAM-dependent methyltransferase
MPNRPVKSDRLQELRDEREAADRAYNDALTAVDRALVPRVATIASPRLDESALGALNASWKITDAVSLPPPRGLRSRLAHFVWRLCAPAFERQQAFNSRLVDHLNRHAEVERDAARALERVNTLLQEYTSALATFQSHLVVYFQQITWFVETKDRLDAASLMAVYDTVINGLTMEITQRTEHANAWEARANGRIAAIGAADDELRGSLAAVQTATAVLKRELERSLQSRSVGPARPDQSAGPNRPVGPEITASLDSYKYVGFEDRFRGSQADIRARLTDYVPLFKGRSDVLDVGCGRGELLDLFSESGIGARGLDVNHEMVEACLARGLDAVEGDLVAYLDSLPDGSLGGLIAIQVVEHLEPSYLMRTLDIAFHKLRPGSPIVLETINPACWFAFFSSYIRDLTHVRPIHPDTLEYLLTASGFSRARIDYRAPYPDADKLQPLAPARGDTPVVADFVATFNSNVQRLNGLLFTYLDYAAIGERA